MDPSIFAPFDLGRVLQTAGTIKLQQQAQAEAPLRSQLLQTQLSGAQQQQQFQAQDQAQQQAVTQAKQHYLSALAIENSSDPIKAVQDFAPEFQQQFDKAHGPGAFAQLTPDQVKSLAQHARAMAGATAGITPQIEYKDVGDKLIPYDKTTGKPADGLATIPKAASPDSQLSAHTSRENNAATIATTQRGQNMTDARDRQKDLQPKIPDGYQPDPTHPGSLMPIPGGPKDPDSVGAGGLGNRAETQYTRIALAGHQIGQIAQNLAELPSGASTGYFGGMIGSHQGTTLIGATKSALANLVSSQGTQDYNLMATGVERNLAAIEAAGLAPQGSLTSSMGTVKIIPGDTELTRLRRMAEIRQIAEKGMEVLLTNPKFPQQMKDGIQKSLTQLQTAIPYTQHDVTMLEQSKNPQATISDVAKLRLQPAAGNGPAPGAVEQGYRFKGGNPADQANWEPAN